MRTTFIAIVGACALLSLGSSVLADSPYVAAAGRTPVDPELNFEQECLGETPAENCDDRAAALSTELMDVLSALEGDSSADVNQLFQRVSKLDDPMLNELSMRYFKYFGSTPPTLWERVKEFFFGPNPGVGAASAELLRDSPDPADAALRERYLEAHRAFGGDLPDGTPHDEWLTMQVRDYFIDAMLPFAESEQFTPATRLLMNDFAQPYSTFSEGNELQHELLTTGFVTDSSVEEVSQFFTGIFGHEPYRSGAEASERYGQIMSEILSLTAQAITGDMAAIARVEELSAELQSLQSTVQLSSAYYLQNQNCADHLLWFAGDPKNLYRSGELPRAVVVGTDSLLGRTVIRYMNGMGVSAPGSDAGAGGDASGDGDQGPGDGDADGAEHPKRGGGGCAIHPAATHGSAWWLALGLLSAIARRRRRRCT